MGNLSLDFSDNTFQPLAARMRPENLAQYIGQQHLLAAGKPLPRAIEAGHLHSMILWGPPGTGKTTLAEVIARYANADVERISAVTSGVKEIREAIERARQNRNAGRRTILFVDEVHRFNKSQQDAFLPHIEDGTITFIGATTENPSFELNSALLSRARVYLLKSLSTEDIEQVLTQAMEDKTRGYGGQDIVLPDETRRAIAELVNGDARRALNTLEMMADMAEVDDSGKRVLKPELLTEIAGERSARFDNGFHHTRQVFVIRASGIFGIEFDILYIAAGILHCRYGTFDNLLAVGIEFISDVRVGSTDTGMNTFMLGKLQSFRRHVNIFLYGTCQGANRRPRHSFGNLNHRVKVTRTRNGESRLNHIHAQRFQLPCHLNFFHCIQLASRNLLAIAERCVENK